MEKRIDKCIQIYPERFNEIQEICSNLFNSDNSSLICHGESGCGKHSVLKSLLLTEENQKVSWISLGACKDSKHVLRSVWHHFKNHRATVQSTQPTKFVQLATMMKDILAQNESVKILLVLEGIQHLRGMDEDLTSRFLHLNKVCKNLST